MTIPDQTLSLKEIVKRYVRGGEIQQKQPQYFDEEEIPEFEKMDKVEQAQFAKDLKKDVENFRQRLQQFENDKRQKSLNAKEQSDIPEGKKPAERSEEVSRKSAEEKSAQQ